MGTIRSFTIAIMIALGLLLSPAVRAQGGGDTMPKMADTAESHLAVAKWYEDKAAEYRKEAEAHRQMLAAYKAMTPGPAKSGQPNPWVGKMEKHCQAFIDNFEKIAKDAQQFAAFERSRAKELETRK